MYIHAYVYTHTNIGCIVSLGQWQNMEKGYIDICTYLDVCAYREMCVYIFILTKKCSAYSRENGPSKA